MTEPTTTHVRPDLPADVWGDICRVASYDPGPMGALLRGITPFDPEVEPSDELLLQALVRVGRRAHWVVARNPELVDPLAYELDAVRVWQSVPQPINDYLDARVRSGELVLR